ncbi:NAD(P)-binding domain-containing protein [Thermomonospora umbrina]|uniref:Lysine/ornithine N-monooxygenase n=1 Tax=Thermomonospora umbrina TaxID=111806 RepID=A0A3D9SXI1_9ACTN|nr:NAD(P)-binding domain-containing protein [Thermomonospora umbrina]REE97715.1 lysine/ornithine N-monooxygenase [Thermomonospora umbrina]
MNDSTLDVLVVGAGPYGLSVGAHAGHLGLSVRVVGRPMRFWDEHMPRGMLLKSEPFASGLGAPVTGRSFLDFCAEHGEPWAPVGRPVPLERFVAYGRWYARQAVPEVYEAEVLRVDRSATGYRTLLATGETVVSRTVVIAVGVHPYAYTPSVFAGLPPEVATHSSDHRDLAGFVGKDVAVIGAGQSALETAALLAEAGAQPVLVARTDDLAWNPRPTVSRTVRERLRGPHSGLGTGWRTWVWSERPQAVRLLPGPTRRRIVRTTLGPAGAWWLRDRLGDTRLLLGCEVAATGWRNDRVRLTLRDRNDWDRTLTADHVIAATGYVPDLNRLTLLSTSTRRGVAARHGCPVLSRSFESSLPGLYFAGLSSAAAFGPVMRFVHGADFAARRIAAHVAATATASSLRVRERPAVRPPAG